MTGKKGKKYESINNLCCPITDARYREMECIINYSLINYLHAS